MKRILGLIVLCLIPVMAFAEAPREGFSYHGYARGGVSANAQGDAVAGGGFTTDGAYNSSRLANEGNYSEHLFKYTGVGESMWWSVNTRVAFDIPEFNEGWNNISSAGYGVILPESYLQLGWIDSGVTLWAGNRYNDSVAVDLYDYYINDMSSAYGVGVDGVAMGSFGNLSVSYLMAYDGDVDESSADGTIHSFALRPHFDVGGGTLSFKVIPSVATGNDGARYGAILESTYKMGSFFGFAEGSTEFFAHYSMGTGVGNVGYSYDETDAYRTGGGFQANTQLSDKWSLKTAAMVEARANHADADTAEGIWYTAALRPFYSFTSNFGLMAEYGFDYFAFADDSDSSMLNRVTLAPTVTLDTGNSVFSDPIIMFYMTYAHGDMKDDVLIDGTDDHGFKYGVMFQVGW